MADTKTYTVRLIDCGKARDRTAADAASVGADAESVSSQLKTWYSAVCHKASSANTTWNADVQWLDQPTSTPSGGDAGGLHVINMIVFFVPYPRDSVILLHPDYSSGFALDAITDPTRMGTTVTQGATQGSVRTPTLGISEVYVHRLQDPHSSSATPLNLARAAFHESMHNQLGKGDELHNGDGFAKSEPSGNTPSAANISAMAAKVGTLTPQWQDGFREWLKWNKDRLKMP
jgi:hypothetical protein